MSENQAMPIAVNFILVDTKKPEAGDFVKYTGKEKHHAFDYDKPYKVREVKNDSTTIYVKDDNGESWYLYKGEYEILPKEDMTKLKNKDKITAVIIVGGEEITVTNENYREILLDYGKKIHQYTSAQQIIQQVFKEDKQEEEEDESSSSSTSYCS